MPAIATVKDGKTTRRIPKTQVAAEYARQAERLAQYRLAKESHKTGCTQAVQAKFVTGQDPVIETADGGRLPAVPIEEAVILNALKDALEDRDPSQNASVKFGTREAKDGTIHGVRPHEEPNSRQSTEPEALLRESIPQSRTNPLFPPLPLYEPPTLLTDAQCLFFRASSAVLSLCFLLVIVMGAIWASIPTLLGRIWCRMRLKNPDARRPFHPEEQRRKRAREEANRNWKRRKQQKNKRRQDEELDGDSCREVSFVPTEGGPDPLVCDVSYYARRVGLDCETFSVQTEDGFITELWHLYNPQDYTPTSPSHRQPYAADIFPSNPIAHAQYRDGDKKYPVLLIHGLLQSAGAYCCTDEGSLAFYLAKSGYDVWLGNNRCGFTPRHNLLQYSDPRMWAWNIRQMGVMDLPALISRVLSETGFEKLGLVAHSQGTTQTLVALAKEQRPEIGDKISVFCALAPAAYAGRLIGKMYFKFMRVIGPAMFRAIFGIHAFIPFMMRMHSLLPGRFYGMMGYLVFSFLFNWTDERWERDLRDRCFQFAPVYVSAESMRWWLGRECFATQKCILATREEGRIEDKEDEEEDEEREYYSGNAAYRTETGEGGEEGVPNKYDEDDRGKYAWYNEQVPPMALWVAGADDLVDGRRLLKRFERGREPHVDVVHSKVIEGYEHLDVIWAMDSLEKVGREVKEVIWKTAPREAKKVCRTPKGCEEVEHWEGRSKGARGNVQGATEGGLEHKTTIDASAGGRDESEKERKEMNEKWST